VPISSLYCHFSRNIYQKLCATSPQSISIGTYYVPPYKVVVELTDVPQEEQIYKHISNFWHLPNGDERQGTVYWVVAVGSVWFGSVWFCFSTACHQISVYKYLEAFFVHWLSLREANKVGAQTRFMCICKFSLTRPANRSHPDLANIQIGKEEKYP